MGRTALEQFLLHSGGTFKSQKSCGSRNKVLPGSASSLASLVWSHGIVCAVQRSGVFPALPKPSLLPAAHIDVNV